MSKSFSDDLSQNSVFDLKNYFEICQLFSPFLFAFWYICQKIWPSNLNHELKLKFLKITQKVVEDTQLRILNLEYSSFDIFWILLTINSFLFCLTRYFPFTPLHSTVHNPQSTHYHNTTFTYQKKKIFIFSCYHHNTKHFNFCFFLLKVRYNFCSDINSSCCQRF